RADGPGEQLRDVDRRPPRVGGLDEPFVRRLREEDRDRCGHVADLDPDLAGGLGEDPRPERTAAERRIGPADELKAQAADGGDERRDVVARHEDRLDGLVDRHRNGRLHQVNRAPQVTTRGDVHDERRERDDGVDDDEQLGSRGVDPPHEREQRDEDDDEGESQAEDHVAAGPSVRIALPARAVSAATSDASVGVAPTSIRAPTRAASGGSRYDDASSVHDDSAKTSVGVPSRITRPSRMTMIRSNDSATNAMSWLIATTVRPSSASPPTIS